jgi:hypothetical protein
MIMWTSAPRDRQEVDVEVRHGALSHLASKGSLADLAWFANPLTLLKPVHAKGQVLTSKNG